MQNVVRVNQVLYRWIRLNQNGTDIKDLIRSRGYKNIAIYGFTDLARCMVYEIDGSELNICYIIDMQGKNTQINIDTYTLNEVPNKDIDAVICCYLDDGDIMKELKKSFECDVITIEELLYEL